VCLAAVRFNVGMVDAEPVVRWAQGRLAEGKRREARRAVEELAIRRTDPDTWLQPAEFFQYLGDHDAAILYTRRPGLGMPARYGRPRSRRPGCSGSPMTAARSHRRSGPIWCS